MSRLLRKLQKRDWGRKLVIGKIVRFLKMLRFQRNSAPNYAIIFEVDMIEVIWYYPLSSEGELILRFLRQTPKSLKRQ